jgi:hypothetical protein
MELARASGFQAIQKNTKEIGNFLGSGTIQPVMCRLTLCYALLLVSALAPAQNIFTVAGYPRTHRDSVDSAAALNAPLGSVYGLLIDRPTGRLLFNDESLVLRLEPDGSLLTIAGLGNQVVVPQLGGFAAPPVLGPASFLQPAVLRGMAEDSTGVLYLADAGAGRIYRVGLDGLVTTFAGGEALRLPDFRAMAGWQLRRASAPRAAWSSIPRAISISPKFIAIAFARSRLPASFPRCIRLRRRR